MGKQPKLLIEIEHFCNAHRVEQRFIAQLEEIGLIEFEATGSSPQLSEDTVATIERLLRLQSDFNLSIEGLEAVFHLSSHVQELKAELREIRQRLRFYE